MWRRGNIGGWFIAPFMVMFLAFALVPLGYSICISFFTSRLIGGTRFSGLENYIAIFNSVQFWSGMLRVLLFAAIEIPILLGLAVLFATMFDLGIARFGRMFRAVFLLPFAVPGVVAAIMWSFLLEAQFGPVSRLGAALGLGRWDVLSPGLLLPSIVVIVLWEWTGYNMVIVFTALKAVPREVVEAAMIDGASYGRIVRSVKVPMIGNALTLLGILNVIGALQLFTEPNILSSFTPNVSYGFTPSLFLYHTAIGNDQFNLAAAGAVVLALVIIGLSVVSWFVRRRAGSASREIVGV
jgi:multiple sugar transport system permease protein